MSCHGKMHMTEPEHRQFVAALLQRDESVHLEPVPYRRFFFPAALARLAGLSTFARTLATGFGLGCVAWISLCVSVRLIPGGVRMKLVFESARQSVWF